MKPPHNVAFLERAIRKSVDTDENGVRLRTMMANVIVGQFLDGAVMRGGGSLKLRYGVATTLDSTTVWRLGGMAFLGALCECRRRIPEKSLKCM